MPTGEEAARSIAKQLGHQIVALRERRHWTTSALAQKAGLSPSNMGLIEKGERFPQLDSLVGIAVALEVESLEHLFGPILPTSEPLEIARRDEAP
jgi:transcriptional regulator with XRE-family HTH domain